MLQHQAERYSHYSISEEKREKKGHKTYLKKNIC